MSNRITHCLCDTAGFVRLQLCSGTPFVGFHQDLVTVMNSMVNNGLRHRLIVASSAVTSKTNERQSLSLLSQ